MKTNNLVLSCLAVAAAGLFASGCTHNMKVKVTNAARIEHPSATKTPLHVGLMITTNYSGYSHRFDHMGDTWVYPFGPKLAENAISVCRQAFREVTVSTNGVLPAGVDAVLTPDLHKTGYAIGMGNKMMFTLLVEWTLRDTANRNILWMTTADAQATASRSKVFQALFDDLSAKEYRAFLESAEIKRVVAK